MKPEKIAGKTAVIGAAHMRTQCSNPRCTRRIQNPPVGGFFNLLTVNPDIFFIRIHRLEIF
jgi:hypothetical protein